MARAPLFELTNTVNSYIFLKIWEKFKLYAKIEKGLKKYYFLFTFLRAYL